MSSNKKCGYTLEFKLRVLEYYFKNGGKNKFGLKSKTAQHFCIDHKTVSRMLCNPEIVKKAQQLLKKSSGSRSERSNSSRLKGTGQPHGKKNNISSSGSLSLHDELQTDSETPDSNLLDRQTCASPKISVMELPEDPDYSLLKQTIEPSTNGACGIANLLIKGTEEVRQVITSECDLIYECKVCRNLFRSIINFLAHKRLYCQEKYQSSQQPFKKEPETSMPATIVEPESPQPETSTSPLPPKKSDIESITSTLSTRSRTRSIRHTVTSPTAYKYSPHLQRLKHINETHNGMTKDSPRVYLENICGVSNAVYQKTEPMHDENQDKQMNNIIKEKEILDKKHTLPSGNDSDTETTLDANEISPNDDCRTNVLIEDSKPSIVVLNVLSCDTCEAQFESQELLDCHVNKDHSVERMVYTCPICNTVFLTIWGCVKHLHRIHKKKKHQRERLKHVINSRAHKKVLTPGDITRLKSRSSSPATNAEAVVSGNKSNIIEEIKVAEKVQVSLPSHDCPKCGLKFGTAEAAAASHVQRCICVKEEPKKKIEIQIRKDYNKKEIPCFLTSNNNSSPSSPKVHKDILTEVKKHCVFDKLFCTFCNRSYQTVNVLKRHIAHHIGWTRFSCSICSFRSYDKYVCLQHCSSAHAAAQKNTADYVLDDERLDRMASSDCQNIDMKDEHNYHMRDDSDINVHLPGTPTTRSPGDLSDVHSMEFESDTIYADVLESTIIDDDDDDDDHNISTSDSSLVDKSLVKIILPKVPTAAESSANTGDNDLLPQVKDVSRTYSISSVKTSEKRPLEVANCNRSMSISIVKDVHVNKKMTVESEKVNGEDPLDPLALNE